MKKLAREWNLTIDDEFASINRPLSPEERSLLEADLESGGCRDDLVIWQHDRKLVLLDGHHRYHACKSLDVPFGVIALAVASREEALAWIRTNQRARRNCTPAEMSYLRGKRLDDEKNDRGARPGNRNAAKNEPDTVTEQNESDTVTESTSAKIAAEHGVSARTVERDAAFARAVDSVVANTGGTHADLAAILAGDLGTKKDIERLAELPPDEQRQAVAAGKQAVKQAAGRVSRKPTAKPDRNPKLDLAGVKHAFLALSEDDRMAFLDWVDHELTEDWQATVPVCAGS